MNIGRMHLYRIMFLVLCVVGNPVAASVTMIGTRIIYNGGDKSVDVYLKNKDKFPYVIQTWFDAGDINAAPDNAVNVPFVATPPIFRIQPGAGQVIKINSTHAQGLPQDRESVFYFNFLQVPPSNSNDSAAAGKNKMLVMLRNRVKLFYRPEGLSGSDPRELLSTLKVTSSTDNTHPGVVITNSQPYYVTLSHVRLSGSAGTWNARPDMIPPFSSRTFVFPGARSTNNSTVTVTMVNDQGARSREDYRI